MRDLDLRVQFPDLSRARFWAHRPHDTAVNDHPGQLLVKVQPVTKGPTGSWIVEAERPLWTQWMTPSMIHDWLFKVPRPAITSNLDDWSHWWHDNKPGATASATAEPPPSADLDFDASLPDEMPDELPEASLPSKKPKEPAMPNPVTLADMVGHYNETYDTLAVCKDREEWLRVRGLLYGYKYKIQTRAEGEGETMPKLPEMPPNPFSTRGKKESEPRSEKKRGHAQAEGTTQPGHETELVDQPIPGDEEEVTLDSLIERLQAARQELASILSDAQLLDRLERTTLAAHMAELVIVANGCDAALAPVE